jgi:hypothetical protein
VASDFSAAFRTSFMLAAVLAFATALLLLWRGRGRG